MHESTYVTKIYSDLESVYEKMVDHGDASWREDLSKVEKIDEDTFIETVIDGSTNTVHVLNRMPNEYYEYVIESENFNSHWVGRLKSLGEDETELTITEQLEFKKPLMKFVSRFLFKLKRIHEVYARNLAWSLMDVPPNAPLIEEEDSKDSGLKDNVDKGSPDSAKHGDDSSS